MKSNSQISDQEELHKLGLKLKDLRMAKGFTDLNKFAQENNLDCSQYRKYEEGTADITISMLFYVLNIFNLSMNDFFNEDIPNKDEPFGR
ncbi:hypothetical protein [Pedobacter rhodius]|uniref:HTH cro/C1-type domain-containing protein n=1 Tax=Pedobacter rhodius TaxID=3004098 RepID=A0ABT4KX70_9SPHI|nr:hypothetical protein [Pedobacter sp. SJ11]MCZ4223504.1 hypothetical protein [Pedobacter sp. SJ11]